MAFRTTPNVWMNFKQIIFGLKCNACDMVILPIKWWNSRIISVSIKPWKSQKRSSFYTGSCRELNFVYVMGEAIKSRKPNYGYFHSNCACFSTKNFELFIFKYITKSFQKKLTNELREKNTHDWVTS